WRVFSGLRLKKIAFLFVKIPDIYRHWNIFKERYTDICILNSQKSKFVQISSTFESVHTHPPMSCYSFIQKAPSSSIGKKYISGKPSFFAGKPKIVCGLFSGLDTC